MYHSNYTMTHGGLPTPFKVGDKVRTRGDMGSIGGFTVVKIHNEWYCQCRDWLHRKYQFNMAFLEPVVRTDER